MAGSACAPFVVGVALAFAATPAAAAVGPCSQVPRVGSHGMRIDGRSVLVHVPRGIPGGRRVSLVLALHGAGDDGGQMERYSGFSHASDLNRFIVAYPNAVGRVWNLTASRHRANDVAYIDGLLTEMQERFCIDPQRLYAAGISSGGGMVALLGCELSARLAAIAPVAGIYSGQPACHTTRPVSVLEIHGTADQFAPYLGSGGSSSSPGPPLFVRGWVQRDRCHRSANLTPIATRTLLYKWEGCAGGASVEHVRIMGGTHQWPGALPPDPGPPSTICGACQIWSFFSRTSLGESPGSPNGGVGLQG